MTPDHARPLNKRGTRAAPLVGAWLVRRGYLPELALVSDAARTRQTWSLIEAALPAPVPATFLPALYLAGPATLLRILRKAGGRSVIVIAHNPGIAEFAAAILRAPPPLPDFGRYPTGATLVAEFDIDSWADAALYRAELVDFTVPRALEEPAP